MRLFGRGLLVLVATVVLLMPARSEAAAIAFQGGTLAGGSFSFGGAFATDNDVALIYFTLLGGADVTAQITSHLTSPAGFDPILTLFVSGTDYLGAFDYLFDNDTGLFQATLGAGNYLLAVTQYNNYFFPGSGFDFDTAVNGLFTNALFGPAAGCTAFVAFDGSCRSPQFAGSLSVPTQAVPEPATLGLVVFGGGAALLGFGRRRRRSRAAPSA